MRRRCRRFLFRQSLRSLSASGALSLSVRAGALRAAPNDHVQQSDPLTGQLRAQFAEAYEMAKELSQPAAMVTATTTQAKLAGLWIERSEQTRKQPDEMSDAEIAVILRANAN